MDLHSWTSRLREATSVSLPFKGLDEMAAEDDYVHSEGLNVKRSDDPDAGNGNMMQRQEEDECDNEPSSTFSNSGRQKPLHASEESHGSRSGSSRFSRPTTAERTKVAEPNYGFHRSNSTGNPAFGVLEMEAFDSSEHSAESEPTERSRQKHRFMEELDNRLSKTNVPMKSTVTASLSSSGSRRNNKSSSEQKSPGGWLFRLGGRDAKAQYGSPTPDAKDDNDGNDSKENLPPLSRQRIHQKNNSSKPEHAYSVVASSGMLDADDLLALEQMRHLNESQQSEGTMVRFKEIIQAHPRESFIVFTLGLSIGMYFYLRHVSNEDDVK
ncbi:hypothetical protein ACA910_000152 [Epithemia clementina (nom. ined.)]